jgi:hypothetical protein
MDKKLMYIIGGGMILFGGIFWFLENQKQQQRQQKEEYARLLAAFKKANGSQPPVKNTPEWFDWIHYAIGAYGVVNELWEPGGIFNGTNVPRPGSDELDEILNKINQTLK